MAKRTGGIKEGDVLFEMQTEKRGSEAVEFSLTQTPGDFRVMPKMVASWKENYKYHPLQMDVEIYKAKHNGRDCWLLLKQHDYIGYYVSEVFVISDRFGQRLIEKHRQQPATGEVTRKIIVTKRGHDCHVCLEGNPGIWEAGKTAAEALGKLIQTHGAHLGIEIEWSDDNWTQRYLAGDQLTKDR
jgi:hypothetical protein